MTQEERETLLQTLEKRFEGNWHRHRGILWRAVREQLERRPKVLEVLAAMEATGGEPDVIGWDVPAGDGAEGKEKPQGYMFCDCSAESPKGRRSSCYDREAREGRKKHPPETSAAEMAEEMGVELLTEEQYRALQELEDFDTKTSSWIHTPEDVRSLGGALFCDRRYGKVFTYHNGADSYYAARGFRGRVRLPRE